MSAIQFAVQLIKGAGQPVTAENLRQAKAYYPTLTEVDISAWETENAPVVTVFEPTEEVAEQQAPVAAPEKTFFESIAMPLVERGWKVAPCYPFDRKNPDGKILGKTVHGGLAPSPLVQRSNDPAQIRAWGQAEPRANVCVYAVQEPGGLCFVDKDGAVSLVEKYERETGRKFPRTLTVCSSNVGGKAKGHWYFQQTARTMTLPGNISEAKTGGLFSFRVKNEYVASIGSIHPTTGLPYAILDDAPVIPMPDEFLDWLLAQGAAQPKTREEIVQRGKFTKGTRYPALISELGRLWNLGTYSRELVIKMGVEWARENFDVPEDIFNENLVRGEITHFVDHNYEQKGGTKLLLNQKPDVAQPLEWGEPVVMNDSLSPVPPFDTRWLPESIRAWVVDVAERMSVPVDFTAVCALSALAGATGRRVFVYPLKNDKEWKEAICLPGAVVAASGKKKTPTWKPFMNPLEAVEAEWREEYKKAFGEYKAALKEWKSLRKQAEKQDVLFTTPEPREPSPPKRLLINDATYEVIQDILTTNSQGILYFRDELSGWVSELDREGREGQRQFFLSLMNGNDRMSVDRITRDGGSAVLCGTVFGSFQPELLRQFLFESKSVADGTVPRFHLLVWPDETESRAKTDRQANTLAKDAYRTIVETLAPLKEESMFFHFDGEAQELFYKFRDRLDAMVNKENNPGKQSHLLKYEGALPKFAGLFQLLDLVTFANPVPTPAVSLSSADAANPAKTVMVKPTLSGNHTIDAKHYQMAEDFLLEYLVPHMHRVYDSKRNDIQQATYLLADKIRRGELRDGTSVRDIQRKRWVEVAHVAEFALENLAEMNWVRPMPKPAGPGQHAVRYEVNPKAVIL